MGGGGQEGREGNGRKKETCKTIIERMSLEGGSQEIRGWKWKGIVERKSINQSETFKVVQVI